MRTNRDRVCTAVTMVLLLSGCYTMRWSPVAERPPVLTPPDAGASNSTFVRIRPTGSDTWLVLRGARLDGESTLVWPVDDGRVARPPRELRSLYQAGRADVRDLVAIETGRRKLNGGRTFGAVVVGAVVITVVSAYLMVDDIFSGPFPRLVGP